MKRHITCLLAMLLAVSAIVPASSVAAATASGRLTDESFPQIRARYAGKPLVVHVWGMSCGPCLAELPKWGELRRTHPQMNLVLIQADRSPVAGADKTLADAGLSKAERWSLASEFDEYLRASIDPAWIGDMPHTLLVSADGEVVRMRGVANLSEVRRWLDAAPRARR